MENDKKVLESSASAPAKQGKVPAERNKTREVLGELHDCNSGAAASWARPPRGRTPRVRRSRSGPPAAAAAAAAGGGKSRSWGKDTKENYPGVLWAIAEAENPVAGEVLQKMEREMEIRGVADVGEGQLKVVLEAAGMEGRWSPAAKKERWSTNGAAESQQLQKGKKGGDEAPNEKSDLGGKKEEEGGPCGQHDKETRVERPEKSGPQPQEEEEGQLEKRARVLEERIQVLQRDLDKRSASFRRLEEEKEELEKKILALGREGSAWSASARRLQKEQEEALDEADAAGCLALEEQERVADLEEEGRKKDEEIRRLRKEVAELWREHFKKDSFATLTTVVKN